MRIGFFTTRMVLGYGVDLTVHELARRLVERGHEVDVWTPTSDGTYDGQSYRLREIIVHGARQNRVLALLERNARTAQRRLRERLSAEGQSYDVVVPCTHPYYAVGEILEVPQVFFNFGNVPTAGFSWRGQLNWKWLDLSEDLLFKPHSARVVSISRFLHEHQSYEVQQKGRVVHLGGDHYRLPEGADSAELRRAFRHEHGIDEFALLLGYTGRLHRQHPPYKGLTELLAIGRRLAELQPGTVLACAGIGSADDGDWVREQGAVPLLNLPVERMPQFYNALDVYITASRWEGFDLPILEAAWHGVPAVAYNVGAHGEHATAVLVHDVRMDELGRAALTVARDAKVRRALAAEALRKAQQFSWDNSAIAFEAVLREVAGCSS